MNDYGLVYEDEELKNSLTPGSSQQLQAPAIPPPIAAPEPIVPKQVDAQPIEQNVPQRTLPGMPPGIGADELSPYINQQKTAMGKYGPDQQMALEKSLMDQRNSLGYKVADAGKGFADALMQGVARAGNPGWQQQFENQNMAQGQEQLGVMEKAHAQNLQDTQANMQMDMMNPSSAVSKSYQQAATPIFKQMGISLENVSRMPASQIETIATLGLKSQDIQLQSELKKLLLTLQGTGQEANVANQKAIRQQTAQKELGDMGLISRNITHRGLANKLEEEAGLTDSLVTIQSSDGGTHQIYGSKIEEAKKRDPGLKVIP